MTENTSGWNAVGNRLLVQVEKIEEKTASGIFIASETISKEQNSQTIGTVVAVGAGSCEVVAK